MSNPYVYEIKNEDNEFYFGVRWDYDGEPLDDLWKKYFTSSSLVKEIILNKGVNHFTPKILQVFLTKEDALVYEYELIKNNINDRKCLNRAIGKCTIWDEFLKRQVSNSVKRVWENEEYRNNTSLKSSGVNNHNYKLNPWRNVNSDIKSWKEIITIYGDFVNERWDIEKYGYGRFFLMRRYNISQGTARTFIKLIKNNWNPFLDADYLLFLNQNIRVS